MSAPRVKFEIWNEHKQYWAGAWCLITMLHENLIQMKAHGLRVRVGGRSRQEEPR